MQARSPLLASPQVSLNRHTRWTAARLPGLLFSAILGLWVVGCASLPTDVARPVSTALANPGETRLGQAVAARAAKAGTRNDSGFALVSSAELAFTSRMTLIKAAQKTLDIQYYAIFADATTDRMFDALREAAARGVRIRILLDDFNTSGENAQVLKLARRKRPGPETGLRKKHGNASLQPAARRPGFTVFPHHPEPARCRGHAAPHAQQDFCR